MHAGAVAPLGAAESALQSRGASQRQGGGGGPHMETGVQGHYGIMGCPWLVLRNTDTNRPFHAEWL